MVFIAVVETGDDENQRIITEPVTVEFKLMGHFLLLKGGA
jgi:hypothetical protein